MSEDDIEYKGGTGGFAVSCKYRSVKRHSLHDTVYNYIKCISGMVMYLNLVVNPRLLCMRSEGYCSRFFLCVCVCVSVATF